MTASERIRQARQRTQTTSEMRETDPLLRRIRVEIAERIASAESRGDSVQAGSWRRGLAEIEDAWDS